MQRNFLLLLSLGSILNGEKVELNTTEISLECIYPEKLIDGTCIDHCYPLKICGNNTNCKSASHATFCSCKKGFSGDPIAGCFKLDEASPCYPYPCGPNAECFAEDAKIGPHCRCRNGYYEWPPKCRTGCKSDNDCGPTKICNKKHNCKELCKPSTCGENSICRVDKRKRTLNCSCKDGYTPENSVGCRKKTSDDSDIDLESFSSILYDKCGDKCGLNAFCGSNNTCICTQSYKGDPFRKCSLAEKNRTDPCDPNPCGGYSICKIVDETAKCSCVSGYKTQSLCSKCDGNSKCNQGDICSNERCVFNICKPYCGNDAACNIHEGKFECLCSIQTLNGIRRPFEQCKDINFLSAAVIANLSE